MSVPKFDVIDAGALTSNICEFAIGECIRQFDAGALRGIHRFSVEIQGILALRECHNLIVDGVKAMNSLAIHSSLPANR